MSTVPSLREARELWQIINRIEQKVDAVQPSIDRTNISLIEMRMAFNDVIGILRQMGLPPEMMRVIIVVQRLITIINALRISIAAMEATAGPIGWALLGISVTASALAVSSMASTLDGERRR